MKSFPHRTAGLPHLKQPAPDVAVSVLREAILSGSIAESEYLRQDEIAARLGLSKIPVREALRSLEAEGLVTFLPNRGVVAAALSVQESQEVAEMRVALESIALRRSIPDLDARDLRHAAALLDDLDEETDPARQSALNWEFHAQLYTPGNRPLLLEAIRGLHTRVDRYMRLVLSGLKRQRRSQREHRALLDACAARDVRTAVVTLRDHIEGASVEVEAFLEKLNRENEA